MSIYNIGENFFGRINSLWYSSKRGSALDMQLLWKFVCNSPIEGDYLEFGTWTGKALIEAYRSNKFYGFKRNIYVFDSFQGLPHSEGTFKQGMYSCSLRDWEDNLRRHKVDINRIKVIKGWYKDTLTDETKHKLPIKKAAIIWFDCDLYSSTLQALDFVSDYIQEGTLLYFTSWFQHKANPKKGQQGAFNKWHKDFSTIEFPCIHKAGIFRKAFICGERK